MVTRRRRTRTSSRRRERRWSNVSSAFLADLLSVSTVLLAVGAGQSNMVGVDTALSLTQSLGQLRLTTGVLGPLVETGVESPLSSFANWLTGQQPGRVNVVRNVAVSGQTLANMDIGSAQFADLTGSFHSMSMAVTGTESAIAILFNQGEADFGSTAAVYQPLLEAYRTDAQSSVQSLLGSSQPLHLVQMQKSNMAQFVTSESEIPMAQLSASQASPFIHVATTDYHLPFNSGGFELHLTNVGARRSGEYYAKVADKIVSGSKLDPLQIVSVMVSGTTMVATLSGGNGSNLALDQTGMRPMHTYGYRFYSDFWAPCILSSTLDPVGRTVTFQLDRPSNTSHTNRALHYGYVMGIGAPIGSGTGLNGGNIRDTDTARSRVGGDNLWNWHVVQSFPLTNNVTGSGGSVPWGLTGSLHVPTGAFALVQDSLIGNSLANVSWQMFVRKQNPSWLPAGQSQAGIWTKKNAVNGSWDILAAPNGVVRVVLNTGAATYATYNTRENAVTGNVWHGIHVVYSGSNPVTDRVQVYVSGTLVTGSVTGTMPTTIRASTAPMLFGIEGRMTGSWGPALFRDCAIYTSSLSAAQITTLWNAGTPLDLNSNGPGLPRSWYSWNKTPADDGLKGAASIRPNHAILYHSSAFTGAVPP